MFLLLTPVNELRVYNLYSDNSGIVLITVILPLTPPLVLLAAVVFLVVSKDSRAQMFKSRLALTQD